MSSNAPNVKCNLYYYFLNDYLTNNLDRYVNSINEIVNFSKKK